MTIRSYLLDLDIEMFSNLKDLFCYINLYLFTLIVNSLKTGLSLWSYVELIISVSAHIDSFFNHFADSADKIDIFFEVSVYLSYDFIRLVFLL